ncbi:MAG TPA: ester cyclase [Gaiellaceae bacterium]|nr:ester cyclase [Gaiellaceae bacterium]
MSTDPETVARRLIDEGFTGRDLAVCEELISPDLVEHQDFGPGHAPGAAGVEAVIESLHRAYAGFRLEIQHLAVEGDRVWLHLRGSGTHSGPFMGHPPTGREMAIDVFDLLRVENGKVVEHWGVPDRLGALVQLGLVKPPV